MTEPDHYDDISDLSPEDQEFVRLARANYARIDAIPADQRGRLAREKQADAIGISPDGEFFPSGDEGDGERGTDR